MIYYRYESIMIVNSKLDATAIENKIDEYKTLVYKWLPVTAPIDDPHARVENMGIRKLAYEMHGCTEGWYIVFTFWAEPKNIPELERRFRIDDDILKFITVKHMTDDDDYEEIEDEDDSEEIVKCEQKTPDAPEFHPLGQNHYNYLFGYVDELK